MADISFERIALKAAAKTINDSGKWAEGGFCTPEDLTIIGTYDTGTLWYEYLIRPISLGERYYVWVGKNLNGDMMQSVILDETRFYGNVAIDELVKGGN